MGTDADVAVPAWEAASASVLSIMRSILRGGSIMRGGHLRGGVREKERGRARV